MSHPSPTGQPNAAGKIAALEARLAESQTQLEKMRVKLVTAELRIEKLELARRQRLAEKYGPKGEGLSDLQLSLLEDEPGVSAAEVEAEAERGPLPAVAAPPEPESKAANRKKRPHPGRQKLPAHLRREEKIVAVPEDERQCSGCTREMVVIGYEENEQLAVIPAQRYVVVTKREKRACACCKGRRVNTAPAPRRIIEKSLLSDESIVECLIGKYADQTPLYRQAAIMARDCGVEIHRATLDGIVMRVGEMLLPLARWMRREVLASGYVQADETPVMVQWKRLKGREHQAYLWQYGTPGGAAVFDFRMGRAGEGPREILRDYGGLLQTDGYVGYKDCGDQGTLVRARPPAPEIAFDLKRYSSLPRATMQVSRPAASPRPASGAGCWTTLGTRHAAANRFHPAHL